MKAIWEGRDTKGRQVRAYLVTDERAKTIAAAETSHDDPVLTWGTQRIASDIELPALEFRARESWEFNGNDDEWAYHLNWVAEQNLSRAHRGRRMLPTPKRSGFNWVVIRAISLRDLHLVERHETQLGLEAKHSPGMARLSLADVQALCVMVDRALEQRGAA